MSPRIRSAIIAVAALAVCVAVPASRVRALGTGEVYTTDVIIGTPLGPDFEFPAGIAVDSIGRLIVADADHNQVKVFAAGDGHLIAALGNASQLPTNLYGTINGVPALLPGVSELSHPGQFAFPVSVSVGPDDRIYVSDTGNHRIQVFDKNFTFITAFGRFGGFVVDNDAGAILGVAAQPGQLNYPQSTAVDASGRVWVADTSNHRLQLFTPRTGTTPPVYECVTAACTAGIEGELPGQLELPGGVAIDSAGKIIVADTFNHRIVRYDPVTAQWTVLSPTDANGKGILGTGPDPSCTAPCKGEFQEPGAVVVDKTGRIIVADTGNNRVEAIDAAGTFLFQIAGGVPSAAPGGMDAPQSVAIDQSAGQTAGRIAVADTNNHRIQTFRKATLAAAAPVVSPTSIEYASGSITVSFTITNTSGAGGATLANITPAGKAIDPATNAVDPTLAVMTGGSAPVPSLAPAPGGGPVTMSVTFKPLKAGAVAFVVGATATYAATGQAITSSTVTSPTVAVSPTRAPAVAVSSIGVNPGTVQVGDTIAVQVVVQNVGAKKLTNVTPRVSTSVIGVTPAIAGVSPLTGNPPTAVTLDPCPVIGTCPASSSSTFTFTYKVDTASPGQQVSISATATGTFTNPPGTPTPFEFADGERTSQKLDGPTLSVVKDNVKPTTSATVNPKPILGSDGKLWNHGNDTVTVTFTAADTQGGAGVDAIYWFFDVLGHAWVPGGTALTPPIVNEGKTIVTYFARDKAGNVEDPKTLVVNLDRHAPTLLCGTPARPPNAAGWYNSPVTISLIVSDPWSGVASLNGGAIPTTNPTITLTGTSVSVLAADFAGNTAQYSCSLNVDTTAPDAWNQFDPATKDSVVYGRDLQSGVKTTPYPPVLVSPAPWGRGDRCDDDDDDRDDDRAGSELRTYRIADAADNVTTLVERVKRDGKSVQVHVIAFQYTVGGKAGAIVTPPKATKHFEWTANKDGSIKTLRQKMAIGDDDDRRVQVEADYDAKKNQTTIRRIGRRPGGAITIVQPGMVMLRMATRNGQLVIEY